MGIRHSTTHDESSEEKWVPISKKLARWIVASVKASRAQGMQIVQLELQRHRGSSSYVSCGHRWIREDDEEDSVELLTGDGDTLLVFGRDPESLASEICDHAQEHCAENGSAAHYQCLATGAKPDGTTKDLPGPFKFQDKLFRGTAERFNIKDETLAALVGHSVELRKYVADLHGVIKGQATTIAGVCTKLAERSEGQEHMANAMIEIAKLQHEARRDDADARADVETSKRRHEMWQQIMAIAGPAFMVWMQQRAASGSGEPMGAHLARILDSLPDDIVEMLQAKIGEQGEGLEMLRAASRAPSDAEFQAIIDKLRPLVEEMEDDAKLVLVTRLRDVLAAPDLLFLGTLLFPGG